MKKSIFRRAARAALIAALLPAAAFAQNSAPPALSPSPGKPIESPAAVQKIKKTAPAEAVDRWVPVRHLSISIGCLKKWICDCAPAKIPRGSRIKRTPSEYTAGHCVEGSGVKGPRGDCATCTATPPKKKCSCDAVPR